MLKKIIILILFGIWTLGMLGVGYWIGSLEYGANYTSQEIFDAVNDYRASKGLNKLETDIDLCSGLVDRYIALKATTTEGHKDFQDWSNDKADKYGYTDMVEVWSQDIRKESVINGWLGSQGHRLGLEYKGKYGCAFADKAGVVLVIADK